MSLQLAALRASAAVDARAPINLLAQAAHEAQEIDAWCKQQLGDAAPSLVALRRLLGLFAAPVPLSEAAVQTALAHEAVQHAAGLIQHYPPTLDMPQHSGAGAATRDDVLAGIRKAREWFEIHEPSSPVAMLLKQAERMVGKRFSQVADSIPLDLLQKWESEQDVGGASV